MCDDLTEAENAAYLRQLRLTRRALGAGAGAALVGACGPRPPPTAPSSPTIPSEPAPARAVAPQPVATTPPSSEPLQQPVTITTPDGEAEGFFAAAGAGPHPGVLIWPDVAGLRDAFRSMATRLAKEGYAVLVINPYYRSSKLPILTHFEEWRSEEGKAKIAPMRAALTPEGIARDAAAYVAWLDQQPQVDKTRKLASAGYCMGGPFTFRTAAGAPERLGVIASFHGGGLVTDEATSPHTLLAKLKAALLICIAQNDDERDPQAKTVLGEAAAAAQLPSELEVYPAQHGWCVSDHAVYDEAQAERAWSRLLHTFQQYL